jgi:hypothetical protein
MTVLPEPEVLPLRASALLMYCLKSDASAEPPFTTTEIFTLPNVSAAAIFVTAIPLTIKLAVMSTMSVTAR